MVGKVQELALYVKENTDSLASAIAFEWDRYNRQRDLKRAEWRETRNYIFATDTTKTTNSSLPWKNKTTLPKLAQIRDNLHANYMSALFPNDNWLRWEAYSLEDADVQKKNAIEAYMQNKVRESYFVSTMSQLIYDYIDYGNAFATVEFVNEKITDPVTKEQIAGYVGPRVVRISPNDIVFNPLATSFRDSVKITRCLKTLGELKIEAEQQPDSAYLKTVIPKLQSMRDMTGTYSNDDFDKACGIEVEGFGSYSEYLGSNYVEILEAEGTFHDPDSGEMLVNHVITVVDRMYVARKAPLPSWMGKSYKQHVGWRLRPDNLWAMGPLDNLVGMQYRIDHLENLKADVFDLIAFPPLKIRGEVEEFKWAPGAEIHLTDDSEDVTMLVPDTTALQADMQIQLLENRMEEYAGAPKQAMGIRTPGEKTAFEVQTLENAAGRIFQEKVTNFEINLLEPILNGMLEIARRNMNYSDVVRVMDDDLGVVQFMSITREDITAAGKIRPIGARHFSARAQLLQNLTGVFNSGISNVVAPHLSGKAMARLVEDVLQLDRYSLFRDNAAVFEQADTQRLVNQAQEEVMVEQSTPVP